MFPTSYFQFYFHFNAGHDWTRAEPVKVELKRNRRLGSGAARNAADLQARTLLSRKNLQGMKDRWQKAKGKRQKQ